MKKRFRFQIKFLCIPYFLFFVFFIVLPIFFLFFYAFQDVNGHFSLTNFLFLFKIDKLKVILDSFFFSFQTTFICLLISFPVAFFLAEQKMNKCKNFILLFVFPLTINFILRTTVLRDLLILFNISGGQMPYLATLIGMVYNFVPFAILPLYTAVLKLDKSQIEAASDLGCNSRQVFFYNIIPQMLPSIISATIMIFIPVISSNIICDIFSEGKIILFGNSIHLLFSNSQWNIGSFLSIIFLFFIFLLSSFTKTDELNRY